MAARNHPGGPDLTGEIAQRGYRCQLDLGTGTGYVHPHVLVAARELGLSSRAQHQHAGHVQLVVHTARPELTVLAERSHRRLVVHTARPEHFQHVFEGFVILETGQLSLLRHGLTLFQRGIER